MTKKCFHAFSLRLGKIRQFLAYIFAQPSCLHDLAHQFLNKLNFPKFFSYNLIEKRL